MIFMDDRPALFSPALMDFIALDFETATSKRDSPCEIGLAIVRDGVVREVRNWLIKPLYWPHFSHWNIAVHGITPQDVAHAPEWPEVWEEVSALISGRTVVAHNAAFDMGVLAATLSTYSIPTPDFNYFCSVKLARKAWPGFPKYGLKALCQEHSITLQRHHRAGDDAQAAAEIVIKALAGYPRMNVADLVRALKVHIGSFTPAPKERPVLPKFAKLEKLAFEPA
jgi:DNA polymerase-3 subunit epsilon